MPLSLDQRLETEPIASTSALPAEPIITPKDSRQFAALIKENIRLASPATVKALAAECRVRFEVAWRLKSRPSSVNRLPVTALIHSLLRSHTRGLEAKLSPSLSAIFDLMHNQSVQEQIYVDWSTISKRTVRAIIKALVIADPQAREVFGEHTWPACFEPMSLAKASHVAKEYSDIIWVFLFYARGATGWPDQVHGLHFRKLLVTALHGLKGQRTTQVIHEEAVYILIDLLCHQPDRFLFPAIISQLAYLPLLPSSQQLQFRNFLRKLLDNPSLTQKLLRNNARYNEKLLQALVACAFQQRPQKQAENGIRRLLNYFKGQGVVVGAEVYQLILRNARSSALGKTALQAFNFVPNVSQGSTLPVNDAAMAAYLQHLLVTGCLPKALQLTYQLVPRRLPWKYLHASIPNLKRLVRDQGLLDSMLQVAVSAGAMGLALHIWRAAEVTQRGSLVKYRRSTKRGYLQPHRLQLTRTESYVRILKACLTAAQSAHSGRMVAGWNPYHSFHNFRLCGRSPKGRQISTLEGARELAWRIKAQLESYSHLHDVHGYDLPVASYSFRALMWQLADPELTPVHPEQDLREFTPRNLEQAELFDFVTASSSTHLTESSHAKT